MRNTSAYIRLPVLFPTILQMALVALCPGCISPPFHSFQITRFDSLVVGRVAKVLGVFFEVVTVLRAG
jgi:hypothetical protein